MFPVAFITQFRYNGDPLVNIHEHYNKFIRSSIVDLFSWAQPRDETDKSAIWLTSVNVYKKQLICDEGYTRRPTMTSISVAVPSRETKL